MGVCVDRDKANNEIVIETSCSDSTGKLPKRRNCTNSIISTLEDKSKSTAYSSDTEKPVEKMKMITTNLNIQSINEYINTYSYKKDEQYREKSRTHDIICHDIPGYLSDCIELNIVVCGDTGVGKSSLVIRYAQNEFDRFHIVSIIVENWKKKVKYQNQSYLLNFFVTPGSHAYRTDYSEHYSKADCILFMFDFTNKASFHSALSQRTEVLNSGNKSLHVVVGNKSDMRAKELPLAECMNKCKEKNVELFEISAKNNSNIDKMFLKICEIVRNQ